MTLADASGKINGWLILWKCQQQSRDWTERIENEMLTAGNISGSYNSEKWTKNSTYSCWTSLSGRKVYTLTKKKNQSIMCHWKITAVRKKLLERQEINLFI